MSNDFQQMVNERIPILDSKSKWEKKVNQYVESFAYLNSDELIEEQIKKLTCVGINSLTQSADLIQELTSETLDMIDNKLKTLISDISTVVQKFDLLEKTLNEKKGLFKFGNPVEKFFILFSQEEPTFKISINELNHKKNMLHDIKQSLEEGIVELFDCSALLDRDVKLIKFAEEKLRYHKNAKVIYFFKEHEFNITEIKRDLLTQQQIIFQKYSSLRILLDSISNCYRNIDFVSRVTYSAMMNMVEIKKIIQLRQLNAEEERNGLLGQLKQNMADMSEQLRKIAASPFDKHVV